MKAKISEIFKSYQGEGIWQLRQQIFVRFYGCNLKCRYCDTPLDSYREISLEEVAKQIKHFDNCPWVALTGGEPLLQANFLTRLCPLLKKLNKKIYLETNGILADSLTKIIHYLDMISADIKLPSSTGMPAFWDEHKRFIEAAGKTNIFLKAVIGKHTSFEDIARVIDLVKKVNPTIKLILQPENPFENELEGKVMEFEKKCKAELISVKILTQLHKKIGIK